MEGKLGEAAEKRLYDSATKGDVTTFHELLQQDPLLLDRVSFTCSKKTPLHIAAMQGHLDIVEEILNRNPQLAEELDSQNLSALHAASAKGHVEIVSKLLSVAPDMCLSCDCRGKNPLHLAAIKGHVQVVERLVQTHCVAAMERLDSGETVLHLCVKYNQLGPLKVLVRYMSELVSAKDEDGETILHLAVRYRLVEIIQYLVETTNINKKSKNSKGQTPLEILEQSPSDNSTTSEIRNILLPRICISNTTQRQPVEWLAKKRDAIMVVAILIATTAFQAGISPAGGVWQDDLTQDSQGNPVANPHKAGEAVMAYNHPNAYKSFIRSNTVAFVSSLSTILQLISGLPFRHRLFVWMLMVVMWMAVTAIAITYAASVLVVTPQKDSESLSHVIGTGITVWCCVMGVLLVGNTLRLMDRWLKSKLGAALWLPERLRKLFVEVRHDENGVGEGV